MTSRTLHI